jgi:hypothetical protein
MRRMATKGPPPHLHGDLHPCQAIIHVRDVVNIDGEHNRCPKCGEAYKVPGLRSGQQLEN